MRRTDSAEVGPFEKFFIFGYEVLSECGNSIIKPLSWLLGFLVLFAAVYAAIFLFQTPAADALTGSREAVQLAMFNVFKPFGVWDSDLSIGKTLIDAGSWFSRQPLIARIVCSLQSLLSVTCLVLLAISLRRRFQLSS